MALTLNNPGRFDMPLNKETNMISQSSMLTSKFTSDGTQLVQACPKFPSSMLATMPQRLFGPNGTQLVQTCPTLSY